MRRLGSIEALALAALLGCGPPSSPTTARLDESGGGTNGNGNGGATAASGDAPATSSGNATIGPSSGVLTFSGTAGGPYASSVIGGACTGYMGALPSHVLDVTEDIANLRFEGSATLDTVLFVRTPSGEMLCDDDGAGYPNPTLTHAAPAGRYQIWYATYSPGQSAPYTLTVTVIPPARPLTAVEWATVPLHCGMSVADYGPITIGSSVVLGAHRGWTGPDGAGATVTDDTWWNDMMSTYVGMRTTVTEMPGLDPVGCPYVRVEVDGGTWGWRIRDLSP